MIPEAHAACVHHPVVRVTQTPLPKSGCLLPGRGHIAKNHIHHPSLYLCLFLFGYTTAGFLRANLA